MEPPVKTDEEYPLLKVEAGGGDGKIKNSTPITVMTPGWNITCTPKQPCCTRWPEFVSAFWMTLILLAISFLLFYALGMSAYRRQPIVIVRCNNTNVKPGSNVFYHHVIPRNANLSFTLYSDYLSYMATQYPSLHFYVYFLIDDSWQPKYPNSRLLKRLVSKINGPLTTIFNQNQKDIHDFQKSYGNVNISLMYLSKYMAMTPLKYKWKMIPNDYLSFYARIYEISQNGGIGFDLITFNNNFNNNKKLDNRIVNILKQQQNYDLVTDKNKKEKFLYFFDSIENVEQNQLFTMFFNLMNQILQETFFDLKYTKNATIGDGTSTSYRNKHDMGIEFNLLNDTNQNSNPIYNSSHIFYEIDRNNSLKQENVSIETKNNDTLHPPIEMNNQHDVILPTFFEYGKEIPQVLFSYDISGLIDDTDTAFVLPKSILQADERRPRISNQNKSYLLSLSAQGHFVAAFSRHHPFLAQVLSSGCYILDPRHVIKDTFFSQCSGILRDDIYCENIHIIYDLI